TLAAGLAGGLTGDSTADTVAGAQAGKNAVENNALHDIIDNKTAGVSQEQKYQNAQKELVAAVEEFKAQNCAGLSAEACSAKISEHRDELLKGFAEFGIDFVPIIGDIKSLAEAQSALDYLVVAISIIPGVGDAAGKAIKAAESALKKGDVTEASKLINKASDEISAQPIWKGSIVQSRVNLRVGDGSTGSGLEYAWKKHGGEWGANKSHFTVTQDELKTILQSDTVVKTSVQYSPSTGNYIRTVDMGKNIGVDAMSNGAPTSIMTVITDKQGNLINTFPGKTVIR
uniref:VENN motif pre-toxin domain-containing protein n=1 Tax=Yersinia hibernica TaxID=2339259 RepID=UPI0011A9EB21